ncbi:MFS monocarboxylate transporter [Aspergillus steynii IBT 23096]|uniref:MFS monocarboxylate transporter n=1 Tax=Aspergillus steynii IBT 23096 TaxID=1392250 RepID=A0A2I2G8Q7_9EURO|nr:MFS monocarboxylate transporter [Aspergillus steynii IBT 23096]PLB49264.1 MFS monocarboxylate transporter [Aspergillus steynii IBT 23096]
MAGRVADFILENRPPTYSLAGSRYCVPPDGGPLAWTQVLAGHFIFLLTWGYSAAFGVFQTHYRHTLPESSSTISWIGGVQVFILLLISALSGRATDAGFTRALVLLGTSLIVLGTFMTSLATTYWQIFLAQGVCVGVGMGLIWLPGVTLVSTYFVRKRVFAMAVAASGTSTAGMVFPGIVQGLIPRVGFPWAVRCMGFVVLFVAVVINCVLCPRMPPRKSGPLVEWAAFKEPSYVMLTFGIFLIYWTFFFVFFYIQVYARQKLGMPESHGANLIIIMHASGVPIRPPLGFIADRYIGPLNCLIPLTALCGMLMFCWHGVVSIAGLYVFAVFFGLVSAAVLGMVIGTIPSLTKDMSKIGTRVGMALTLVSPGPLTGPSVAGALIDRGHGDYLGAQLWAGIALLVGAGVLIAARVSTTGWRLMVKI